MHPATGAWGQRKLIAMRRIQQVGMNLFDARGYQQVTVEDIARAADVSPSSIYRYFGTKESIVLWDEHDRGLFSSIADGLHQSTTLSAVKTALDRVAADVDSLDSDSQRFLRRRIAYIQQEPLLLEAMHQEARVMTSKLVGVLNQQENHAADDLENQVVASAIAQAVLLAILMWAGAHGETLSSILDRSFVALDQYLRFD